MESKLKCEFISDWKLIKYKIDLLPRANNFEEATAILNLFVPTKKRINRLVSIERDSIKLGYTIHYY